MTIPSHPQSQSQSQAQNTGQGQPAGTGAGAGAGFAAPFPPTPNYFIESPGRTGFSPFSVPGGYPQQGFGQPTGLDESYFVGLFPELMGPGFVDGGYAGGLGQGGGGNGFEDALGLWGFSNR